MVEYGRMFFFVKVTISLSVFISISHFLYLFIHKGCLGRFYVLAFANEATVNLGQQIGFEVLVSFPSDGHPDVGAVGSRAFSLPLKASLGAERLPWTWPRPPQ